MSCTNKAHATKCSTVYSVATDTTQQKWDEHKRLQAASSDISPLARGNVRRTVPTARLEIRRIEEADEDRPTTSRGRRHEVSAHGTSLLYPLSCIRFTSCIRCHQRALTTTSCTLFHCSLRSTILVKPCAAWQHPCHCSTPHDVHALRKAIITSFVVMRAIALY